MIPGVVVLAVLAVIAGALVVHYLLATTLRLVLTLAVVVGLGAAVYKLDRPTAAWVDRQCERAGTYAEKLKTLSGVS